MDKKRVAIGVALALGCAMSAQAAIVESWDSGTWGAGWSNISAGTVNAGAAHDGAFGVTLGDASWTYNSLLAVSPGDVVSLWIRPDAPSNGRIYFGFGADGSGTHSFVGTTNSGTPDVRFQDNPAYNFTELSTSAQSWSNQWYRMEILWTSSSSATGNLYDSDGTTLLNSVSQTGLYRTGGGLALRGFGGWDADSLSIGTTPPVPEPETYAMLLAGLGMLGFMARRRKLKAAV